MTTTTTVISILVAILSFGIGAWAGLSKLIKAKYSDKITFIKGDKKITISSKLKEEDRKKLAHF